MALVGVIFIFNSAVLIFARVLAVVIFVKLNENKVKKYNVIL